MGIWTRRDSSRQEPSSPITIDRKVVRFRRLVEQHGAVLDLFADLKDKQSGEYILDSQYIEAGLDRAYEGVRRILYDMHVITDSDSAEGYDRLDRLCSASEKILRDAHEGADEQDDPLDEEAPDWETLALQALVQDLTRLPAYGSGSGSGLEKGPPAPESLTEWAVWAHLRAAQWLTENLPRLSPSPAMYLMDEETEAFCVHIFVLGGVREAEASLRQWLAPEPSQQAEAPSLSPLRYFLEGLRFPSDGTGARRLCLADTGKQRGAPPPAQLELYVGDDFLLLRLPSSLPLRLLWCSLSVEQSENLMYLYGMPPTPLFEQLTPEPFSSEHEPFPAHRCGIAGRWMYWAARFSWAQGEERIRMLGHSLSGDRTVRGEPATREDLSKCLQEGMTVFLEQTALPQKEVNPWKSL
jgi:hypothetical protein